jgi:hypothetical protein
MMDQLLTWLAANRGWISQDVRVVHDESRGFHVRAAKPLPSPSAVITCPLPLTLSWLNLDQDQSSTVVKHIDSPLKACLRVLPEHILSALVLVEQAQLGQASFWHPYIAALPPAAALSTPLYFDHDDLEWLAGTNLAKATQDRRQSWRDEWQRASACLQDAGVDHSMYTW